MRGNMTDEETWKEIPCHQNYEVSDLGRVRNIKTKRILKLQKTKNGYLTTSSLTQKPLYVHRLVMISFGENPSNKKTINHISGNKTDNNLSNLEWSTHSENTYHAYASGLFKNKTLLGKVSQLSIDGKLINTFHSAFFAGQQTGIANASIGAVVKGLRKTAGGFKWQFCN
jgi:NUMOD4 motif/HNH endonuclease